jgi:hypothetical protein
MILKRTLLTAATTAVLITASAGAAQARPVLDPAEAPYCGPGLEWVHGTCESIWLQVGPGQQQSDDGAWYFALLPFLALGALV